MNELNKLFKNIDKSFLLNNNEREEFKSFINDKIRDYKLERIEKLIDEKKFIWNYLKDLLNTQNSKYITYIEIHSKMKIEYLKYIKSLEEDEKEDLENIFTNFV